MEGVEKEKITIACFGGAWPTNIGNSFVDLGSIQSLRMAAPNGTVNFASGFPRWLFGIHGRSAKDRLLIRLAGGLPEWIRRIPSRETKDKVLKKVSSKVEYCFDLINAIESDYVVFSGMSLRERFIGFFGPVFSKLKEREVRVVINGAGGETYSSREIGEFRKFLKAIGPYAFISRDEPSFRNYEDLARYSHNGIDCGFFISESFTPAKLELPKYVILNFDGRQEPRFRTDMLVLRTHHSCWPPWLPKAHLSRPNTLISDSPDDYLNLYANAEEIHSDRVHACVAGLSFGRPCRLYAEKLSASLFDKVGATTIRGELTCPDTKEIEKEKEKQVRFLSEMLSSKSR